MSAKNKFCKISDLHNEADVEQNFARRFIESLGYRDDQIRPKDSLENLSVGLMRGTTAKYRPDFAVKVGQLFRWILEAKAPEEPLDKHVAQPKGYCAVLNGQYKDRNPVAYYVLSNGHFTRLYKWDVNDPILELKFLDFVDGNHKFLKLCEHLVPSVFVQRDLHLPGVETHTLRKLPLEEVNAAFSWCHQHIYKKDAMSQAVAFQEFVKVVFLKLLSDREIRDQYPHLVVEKEIEVPANDIWFSLRWINQQHTNVSNPLNTIQFKNLIETLETEIKAGRKKRIFNSDENINLFPETIKGVVGRLEGIFLFGIDADLNGRLFETFLNATMRGKDLGQFFTPRSIVKLGTKLGRLAVNVPLKDGTKHTDMVIDACSGSGGFLIQALDDMWKKVEQNVSLSDTQKQALKAQIAEKHVYGVDLGKEPPLARIARMNMYLHGDGGSSIFQADILDKEIKNLDKDAELTAERNELRAMLKAGGVFDVVLTNPPFAKAYERKTDNEARILDGYDIAFTTKGGKRVQKPSLKSSLMFLERYHDLLVCGGRLVTIIDDGILSGDDYRWFRDVIREKFIIRAVVSLPGDAFQRSKARVKTSLLVVEKKSVGTEAAQSSAVFMYPCRYIGLDDPARQRTLPIDHINRKKALEEIETVDREYDLFLQGKGSPDYIVSPKKIVVRMDVKSCLGKTGRSLTAWNKNGVVIKKLGDLVDSVKYAKNSTDVISTKDSDEDVTYLRVRYDGYAEKGDEIVASESEYRRLYRVHKGDIAISGMAAFYGSSGIVTEKLDGCVVSPEYLVLRPKEGTDPRLVWMLLRSPEVRADMLLLGTGIARTRVKWETVKDIQVPFPEKKFRDKIIQTIIEAEKAENDAENKRLSAKKELEDAFGLDNDAARQILQAFKPPK